ncbi:MAG: nitrate reductase molybdenum cofactor assembly chaperone [Frankia sp.]|nr:nitrate reductase molybdenum cofactor assembly chaperone [Frankia sp.]
MTEARPPRTTTAAARRRAAAWQAQSLLLGYPDDTLAGRFGLLRRVVAALEEPVGAPLRRFIDHAEATGPRHLAADYVATFDHRRRCCLYLTYYTHGDTRNRGQALVALKRAYADAGWRLGDDELPDHLCVVLEFAAAEPRAGAALLAEHRAGLELLRLALRDAGSPWADVLDSVAATLPALGGAERRAAARLAADGPPRERVGLAPFGTAPPGPPPRPEPAASGRPGAPR